MKKPSRRAFLSFLTLLPVTGLASTKTTAQFPFKQGPDSFKQWSQAVDLIIGPYQSVVSTGRACAQVSIDAQTASWINLFEKRFLDVVKDTGNNAFNDLRKIYRHQVQQDFKDRKTIQVNSYILSRTEAYIFHWIANLDIKTIEK